MQVVVKRTTNHQDLYLLTDLTWVVRVRKDLKVSGLSSMKSFYLLRNQFEGVENQELISGYISLVCLLDIQMEKLNRSVYIQVWNSGEKLRIEV